MVRLYLVRHGHAAATFSQSLDAGLDTLGLAQAEALAERLGPLGPLPIVASPMRRTRETAAPLERRWQRAAHVEPAVSEVPSSGVTLEVRREWLRRLMAGRWSDAPALARWRSGVIGALAASRESSVVVSHFVAINVAVGHATGDDRVVCFSPDNCSVTVIDVVDGALRLVERGSDAATRVL